MEPDPYSWNTFAALFLQADTIQVFSYILIPFLLFFSALLSGAEKAYFSLPDEALQHFRYSKNKTDKSVWKLLENPRQTLSTIFFAKSFAYALMLCLVFWFCWQAFKTSPENGSLNIGIAFLLLLALIFLAEILPKVYYTHHPEGLARSLAPFLHVFQKMLSPFTGLFLATETIVSRKFNLKFSQSPIEDLQEALDATISEETTSEEKEILRGIVAFVSFSARQIMRSRTDIVAFDHNLTLPELIPLIQENNYSRVPVFLEDIDTIEGILYIKDLLPHLEDGPEFKWQSLLRSPFFVPESKKVGDLLKDFQEMHVHMAIVVDEYGGTSGLVTLEDIIEEIVGDIKDEFDDEDELVYSQLDENTYIFDAKTSLHNFCKITGTPYEKLEEVKGENETLAGLMLELFSRIPRTGAEITLEPYNFKVEAANSKKVITVKVHVNPETPII